MKKYAKKEKISCTFACSGSCTAFYSVTTYCTSSGEGSVTRKITVVKGKDINDMQYDGKNVLHSSAWWYDDDGTKHPAFCVDPKLAGPGEIAAGKYDVNGTVN